MSVRQEVLDFWFSEAVRPLWFNATPEFDRELEGRFRGLWEAAAGGGLDHWQETPEGALALVIVLDQFPLNMFRGQPGSFSTEAAARQVAEAAIARGFDTAMAPERRIFLYLPFMHSELLADQERSVALYDSAGHGDGPKWARHHRDIVRRFGRFPHRNAILGRESTAEELAWLASDEAFTG